MGKQSQKFATPSSSGLAAKISESVHDFFPTLKAGVLTYLSFGQPSQNDGDYISFYRRGFAGTPPSPYYRSI